MINLGGVNIEEYNCKKIIYPNGQTVIKLYSRPIKSYFTDKTIVHSDLPTCSNRSINSSVNRSKNKIYDLARSNSWDYFITLTFSDKLDRTNYDLLLKKLTKWLNNIRTRYAPNLKYLFIPEQHKRIEQNGLRAYHFHGLISNIGRIEMVQLYSKKGTPLMFKGYPVYSIKQYPFGFSNATSVVDTYRVSNYICKYISKAICIIEKNKRRYIYSQNLEKPIEVTYLFDSEFPQFPEPVYSKVVDVEVGDFRNTVVYLHYDDNCEINFKKCAKCGVMQ